MKIPKGSGDLRRMGTRSATGFPLPLPLAAPGTAALRFLRGTGEGKRPAVPPVFADGPDAARLRIHFGKLPGGWGDHRQVPVCAKPARRAAA